MDLTAWAWVFMIGYIVMMVAFGVIGQRKVASADDFATARNAYGPLFLAFAFAATTASGATFVGFPGIGYNAGMSALWSVFLYPIGVYLGVLICLRLVSNSGHEFGSRSIPEYLGARYQSDLIRILVSLFSLSLFFYLAGQLVSGIVMFEIMLGLSPGVALGVTATVLMVYVVLGGAHADILTDGVQGFIMVAVGVLVLVMFLMGYGIDGGLSGMLDQLRAKDEDLVMAINKDDVLYHSWWSVLAVLLAHIAQRMERQKEAPGPSPVHARLGGHLAQRHACEDRVAREHIIAQEVLVKEVPLENLSLLLITRQQEEDLRLKGVALFVLIEPFKEGVLVGLLEDHFAVEALLQRPHKGGLTRPVGADQTKRLALADL